MSEALQRAITILGSQTALAERLGVSRQAVSHWVTGFRELPADRCVDIERVTDGRVRRVELRPDIFGPVELTAAGQGD